MTRDDIKVEIHLSSRRRIFHCIANEIVEYLFYFVGICPHQEDILQSMRAKLDVLVACIDRKELCHLLKQPHDILSFHLEPQAVFFELVEVHHLVDELQHTVHAAVHHLEQSVLFALYALVVI